jgi:hypothetical protein
MFLNFNEIAVLEAALTLSSKIFVKLKHSHSRGNGPRCHLRGLDPRCLWGVVEELYGNDIAVDI